MKFSYTAAQTDGRLTRGVVSAADEAAVVDFLARQDLKPVSIIAEQGGVLGMPTRLGGRITITDTIFLTKYLALMLRAGTDLFRALDILINDFEKPAMKNLLIEIRSSLEKGQPFYTTFAKYPRQFEPVFVNLIKAGEVSGNLESVFENLSVMLQKKEALRRRIITALTYPIILFCVSLFVVIFLVSFALPRLAGVFLQGGLQPPAFSRMVFAVSIFISNHLFMLGALLIIGGGGGWFFLWKTSVGRRVLFSLLNHVPVIKTVIMRIAIQRFAATLSSLMRAGLPIIDSLELTATALGNDRFETALQRIAREGVSRGLTLGDAFRKEAAFPLVVTTLIALSEKGGNLDQMLATLSTFYESEIDAAIKTMVTLIEPVMLVILGGLVGFIALSVLVPIYELTGQF